MGNFSHQFLGSFGFCLPMGLAGLWALYTVAGLLVRKLPAHRQPFWLPLCATRRSSLPALVLSLLVGAWTHQLLDSFTHKNGWVVDHFEFLQLPLVWLAGHQVRVFHLLWYACSFGGVAILCLAYDKWKRTAGGHPATHGQALNFVRALLYGALALLLGAAHHLTHADWGLWATGVLTVLLVLAISGSVRLERNRQTTQ